MARARLFGVLFAGSSLITPFFLGAVAGAIASGRVPATGRGDLMGSWVTPTSLWGGAIAVGTCAFLAGCFLCAEADRTGRAGLVEGLRRRTLGVGVVTGAIVFAALWPIHRDAPTLAALLWAVGLAFVVVVPPLVYLFRLTQSEAWAPEH